MAGQVLNDVVPKESDPLIANKDKCSPPPGWDPGLVDWFLELKAKAGYELLVILFFSEHLGRGVIGSLIGGSSSYVYRDYHVPATKMQIYSGIVGLPWALKPVVGLVSDLVPIGYYNRAPYMVIVTGLGTAAFVCVGVIPASSLPIAAVVACFFTQQLQLSTNDLLTEATYAEKIRETPEIGPSILSYVWFGMNAGGLVGTLLAGWLVSYSPKLPFTVAVFASVPILAPLVLGYLKEKPVTDEELAARRARIALEGEVCLIAGMMVLSAAALALCGLITGDPTINGCVAIAVLLLMLTVVSLVLTPVIAKFTVFSMLQPALTLSISGAGFYFGIDTPAEFPQGPHFSVFFLTSVMGTVGQVMSLVGVLCYQRYMSTWRYRSLLMVSNIAYTLVSLLGVLFYTRLNLKLGIPDHVFVLGGDALQQLIYQWQWMPQVVILAYLCPAGIEATMFALLAGCHNLGCSVSSTMGSLLLKILHIEPNGSLDESAQFKNLWIASAISSVLPLITILLLIKLVPDGQQGEKLIPDGQRSATAGSLWRTWMGRETATHSTQV